MRFIGNYPVLGFDPQFSPLVAPAPSQVTASVKFFQCDRERAVTPTDPEGAPGTQTKFQNISGLPQGPVHPDLAG
jgi:hypothetical protein